MTFFPVWFLRFLMYGSLVLCVAGVVTLLVLLFIDIKKRRMW